VTWPASATGYRVAYISVTPFGFSNQIRGNSITSVATGNNMTSTPMNSQYLPAGSTIQFFVVQNSGSTSTAQPIFLNIKWEGDIA